MPRTTLCWAVLLMFSAGCKSFPLAPGPEIGLAAPPPVGAGAFPLEVVDARPAWERRYYEGDISFLPLENVTPSPWPHLQRELDNQFAEMPDRPCRGKLVVRSFRVIVNDEERVQAAEEERHQAEQERKDRDRETNRQLREAGMRVKDDDDDPLGEIFGEAMTEVVVELGKLAYGGLKTLATGKRTLRGPPRQLGEDYGPDATCQIKATATLEWPDGRSEHRDLCVTVNSAVLEKSDGSRYPGRDLPGLVQATLQRLATRVIGDTARTACEDEEWGPRGSRLPPPEKDRPR
jgi:hypothetical protein